MSVAITGMHTPVILPGMLPTNQSACLLLLHRYATHHSRPSLSLEFIRTGLYGAQTNFNDVTAIAFPYISQCSHPWAICLPVTFIFSAPSFSSFQSSGTLRPPLVCQRGSNLFIMTEEVNPTIEIDDRVGTMYPDSPNRGSRLVTTFI